jgi:uncharacterized RmlC-like cupin family protein
VTNPGVALVRSEAPAATAQGLPAFVGICERTAGSRGISMNLVVVPPGAVAEPHLHQGFETAIYQLSGRVETRYGDELEHSVITGTGDFLFIAADVPHQARNLSDAEPATAVVARNDPNEQESVVLYTPSRSR